MSAPATIPLSIVMPVWNRADIVQRTLNSILSQRGIERCRLIVIDNNSTDNSRAVIYATINQAVNQPGSMTIAPCFTPGAAAARNAGLSLVDTPWVMHFDSDDTMRPGLIESILHLIDKSMAHSDGSPSINMITWDIVQHLPDNRYRIAPGVFQTTPLSDIIVHGLLSTQRYACKKELLTRAGGWDESCRGWDDLELSLRLTLLKPQIAHIDAVMVDTYLSDNSITQSQFSIDPQKWEHALDLMSQATLTLSPDISKKINRWIDYRRIILSADYRSERDNVNAKRLYRTVSERHTASQRVIDRLIYLKHLAYSRGTSRLAKLLLPNI